MKYNDLINELLNLLDENQDIKKIKDLKKTLLEDDEFQKELETYHLIKTVEQKKKLFQNTNYLEYLKSESNILFLIQDIKNKFSEFNNRKCSNESN